MLFLKVFLLALFTFTASELREESLDSSHDLSNEQENASKVIRADNEEEAEFDNIGEILESMLHGGEKHVHTKEHKSTEPVNETTGSFDPEVELESILHGDDGHVHEKEPAKVQGDGIHFEVKDADHLLHGSDSHFHELFQEAVDGSRPLAGSEPVVFDKPEMEQATIGTINPEDYVDYKRWKKEKENNKDGGWLGGFSFFSDMFRYDFESFKDRYMLSKKQDQVKHDEG